MNKSSKLKFIILGVVIIILLVFICWRNYSSKASSGIATLTWDKSTDARVVGYKVYYGTKPRTEDCPMGGYDKNIDVKNKNKYVIENLDPGKTYYFSVTSYNSSSKESCFSAEMKKTISKFNWLKRFF